MARKKARPTSQRNSPRARTVRAEIDLRPVAGALTRANGTAMAVNPRELKPAQLLKLLNSTPAGTTLTERRLYSHRMAAGAKITAAKNENALDLLRYAAWLASQRPRPPRAVQPAPSNTPPPRKSDEAAAYDAHKERSRARQADQSRAGREIGSLPAVKNPARREACSRDLQLFASTYFPQRFTLKPSPDHHEFWSELDHAVRHGGLLAEAMPRGSGKTTMIEVAAIFGIGYGFRRYVVPIGPTRPDALKMLRNIKGELESNELLAEDFPEICFPIRALDGIAQRSKGQLCNGERTNIEWGKECIVLPTIPGAASSSAIIEVRSVTGAIRGMRHRLPDGTILRPDLALVDDFQTKRSAKSPQQCQDREEIMHGDVVGLAGPDKTIACFVTCTVIRKGDAADRLLDRELNPQWNGKRVPMMRAFPKNDKLWAEYADLRREGLRGGDRGASATAFYKKNRKAMDEGADHYWPARFKPNMISAVQEAMSFRLDNEDSFWAECQNAPRDPQEENEGAIKPEVIEAKCITKGGVKQGVLPLATQQCVAAIDVQQKVLFWGVGGFGQAFTGHVADYGAWPDQGTHYFNLRDARRTMARQKPGAGLEAQIYHGLTELVGELLGRKWITESGVEMSIGLLLIDANWGKSTDTVYQFCRESPFSARLMPSHGRGISGAMKPLNEYDKRPGDRLGHYWRVPAMSKRLTRYVLYDANYWKSLLAERWRSPVGDPGSMSLFSGSTSRHRMLIEQATAEFPISVHGRGRRVDEWKLLPGRDNHLFDILVMLHVAASMQGIETATLVNSEHKPAAPRKRIKLSELQGRRL